MNNHANLKPNITIAMQIHISKEIIKDNFV